MNKDQILKSINILRNNKNILYIDSAQGIAFALWAEFISESYNRYVTNQYLSLSLAIIAIFLIYGRRAFTKENTNPFVSRFGMFLILLEIVLLIGFWQLTNTQVFNIFNLI